MCLQTDILFSPLLPYEQYFLVYHVKANLKKKSSLIYRANTKYSVNVFGMFDGGESLPLAGQEKTTLSDDPDLPPYQPSGKVV